MKKIIKFFTLIFVFICGQSSALNVDLDDIYVQIGNQILPLRKVMKNNKIKNYSALQSEQLMNRSNVPSFEYEKLMNSISPNSIFLTILFSDVKSNKIIFFDNNCLTDKDEKCIFTKEFIQKIIWIQPGFHNIELKEKNYKIVDSQKVEIYSNSSIKCSGLQKMECVVMKKD